MTTVKLEVADNGVAWVVLDRPDAMNALNGELLTDLEAAAKAAAADPRARLIAVTGSGDRAFSAGADLKERRGMDKAQTYARIDLINRVFDGIAALPRATCAAMNGGAFGGGLELALACDFRIAVAAAHMGLTEVRLGILPGAGGTQRLPRAIGVARAKEMILLGRRLGAARALDYGLVHQVVADVAALRAAVDALADELAGCAPLSVARAKEAIDRGAGLPLADAQRVERACYETTIDTEDRAEGMRAFVEKRSPKYQGR